MYKNRASDGSNNLCGKAVQTHRKQAGLSQNGLAVLLQNNGLDVDKNAIQRIECGKRFVTDIELKVISSVLHVSYTDLLD